MSAIDLKVEGRKSNQEQVAEKYQEDAVLEQVSQMDMELPRAAEVVPESRDVAQPSQDVKIAQAEDIVKKYPTDRQRATLAKARAAKAEKRKLREMEGRQAAQGTPVPDLINQVTDLLQSKFDAVNKQLEDMKRYLPYEAPLQTNHLQAATAPQPVELESASQLHQLQNIHVDNQTAVPLPAVPSHTAVPIQPLPDPRERSTTPPSRAYPLKRTMDPQYPLREAKRNRNLFTRAMNSVNFNSDEVAERAKFNFDAQGGLPSLRPDGIFF